MKVLVIRPDHIGDMLLTTPFLSALKNAFPGWHVTIACGSWSAPVLKNNPHYDEIIEVDFPWLARGRAASWLSFLKTIRSLRSQKFDIVFNLRKAAKTSAVAWSVHGRETWGFDVLKSTWAHSRTIRYRTDIHCADLYCEFITAQTGINGIITTHGLEFYIKDEEIRLLEEKVSIPERFVLCSPGAGYPEKLWLAERWARVADWIATTLELPVLFTGGREEQGLIRDITGKMEGRYTDMAGQLSLREAAVLVKKARFVISVDSAMMHIASAVGTPVVALFGPTNPVHWGPYPNGKTNRVLSKVHEFKQGRGSTNNRGGMDLITEDDVLKAISEVCVKEDIVCP